MKKMFEIKKQAHFSTTERLLYNIMEELKILNSKYKIIEEVKEIPKIINKKAKRKG